MAKVLAKAVRDRERAAARRPRRSATASQTLRVPAERTPAHRRPTPAAGPAPTTPAAASSRPACSTPWPPAQPARRPTPARSATGSATTPTVREALERMWPVLTPAQLLHDLFGSQGAAAPGRRPTGSTPTSVAALHRAPRRRRRRRRLDRTTTCPLLDEARALLGPRPRRRRSRRRPSDDEVRTYGHIVVDEAQDLSPMQLRMLARRSLNGSMTIVGDIAQATGAWAHDELGRDPRAPAPQARRARRAELTIGYRIPAPNMALAARVLAVAAPDLRPPDSVREDGDPPRIVAAPTPAELAAAVVARWPSRSATPSAPATSPSSARRRWSTTVAAALDAAGIEFGARRPPRPRPAGHRRARRPGQGPRARRRRSSSSRPAIVDEEAQGMRALYVALTRATKRLAIVHAARCPNPCADLRPASGARRGVRPAFGRRRQPSLLHWRASATGACWGAGGRVGAPFSKCPATGEQPGGNMTNARADRPVCLVRPPAVETFRFSSLSITPPLGLAYVAGAIERAGAPASRSSTPWSGRPSSRPATSAATWWASASTRSPPASPPTAR